MKIDTKNYITVQSYARDKEVSVMTVYRWLNSGSVEGVEIDGVKFVKKEANENNKRR